MASRFRRRRASTGTPYRRRIEIGEGTHMVVLEKNRRQAIDAIPGFLGEAFLPTG